MVREGERVDQGDGVLSDRETEGGDCFLDSVDLGRGKVAICEGVRLAEGAHPLKIAVCRDIGRRSSIMQTKDW